MKGLNDKIKDISLRHIRETVNRTKQSDPAQGSWHADGLEINIWTDVSLPAIEVVLESKRHFRRRMLVLINEWILHRKASIWHSNGKPRCYMSKRIPCMCTTGSDMLADKAQVQRKKQTRYWFYRG